MDDRSPKITVAVYWPGEGYGMGEPAKTMEEAQAIARRLEATGYGAKSKSTKPNEIRIITTLRTFTVWSDDA